MANPYGDIDPYEVLEIDKSASPIEIKKSYKKLSLKHHPDKVQQASRADDGEDQSKTSAETFQKIQFAYSILSDTTKRNRYDQTGLLDSFDGLDEDGFDWMKYFQSVSQGITIEAIDEDKKLYQGSEEEKQDIWQNFTYYEGDFLKLFEVIPHLEFTEPEENRVFKMIEENIDDVTEEHTLKTWAKYKKLRKTKVKQMLKKLSKEAKEAAALESLIGAKRTRTENDLKALIQSKQAGRLDNLIEKLELKYGGKPKGKKRRKSLSHDIDEEEFQRIQSKLKK